MPLMLVIFIAGTLKPVMPPDPVLEPTVKKRSESSGKEQHSEPLEYVACRHVGDWGVGGEEEVGDGGNEDGVVFGSRLLVAD